MTAQLLTLLQISPDWLDQRCLQAANGGACAGLPGAPASVLQLVTSHHKPLLQHSVHHVS